MYLSNSCRKFLLLSLKIPQEMFKKMFAMCKWRLSNVCVCFISYSSFFSFKQPKMFLIACAPKRLEQMSSSSCRLNYSPHYTFHVNVFLERSTKKNPQPCIILKCRISNDFAHNFEDLKTYANVHCRQSADHSNYIFAHNAAYIKFADAKI